MDPKKTMRIISKAEPNLPPDACKKGVLYKMFFRISQTFLCKTRLVTLPDGLLYM